MFELERTRLPNEGGVAVEHYRTEDPMKGFGATRKLMYKASELVYAAAVFTSAVLGVATGSDVESGWLKNRPIVVRVVEFLQEYAIPIYIATCALVILSYFYRRRGDPWIWEKLKFILDEYQGKAFTKDPDDATDHHRVTLFQHKKNCLFVRHWSSNSILKPWGTKSPFSDYLIPVLRSGHLSQKSSAVFYTSDSSDDCESVAAKAWTSNQMVVKEDLPAINSGTPKSRDIITYAKATYSTREMVEKYIKACRPMPRSIAAIPIMVSGTIWGVIVLDSRLPNGVTADSVLNYDLTVALVGQLLEKAR